MTCLASIGVAALRYRYGKVGHKLIQVAQAAGVDEIVQGPQLLQVVLDRRS